MAGGDGRLQQVQRSRHVDIDKGFFRKARDVRLVQGAGMDHRLDAVIRKSPLDHGPVRDRSDDIGRFARDHVKPDDAMAGRSQFWRQEASQPAGRACQQYTHGDRPTVQKTFATAACASLWIRFR